MESVLRSEECDVIATKGERSYRIAKIVFGKRDGSLFITFPGFPHSEGLVGFFTLPAGVSSVTTNLGEHGKVAGHLVKYSHHPDGRAQFSQTGKVRTEFKRQSNPLHQEQNHLFTIQIEDVTGFSAYTSTTKRPWLHIAVGEQVHVFKILGRWYRLGRLGGLEEASFPVGAVQMLLPNGERRNYMIVSPPKGAPFQDYVLMLEPQLVTSIPPSGKSHLLFLGGFDPVKTALDRSRDTSCLVFSYPCSDPTELRKTVGTIDLNNRN